MLLRPPKGGLRLCHQMMGFRGKAPVAGFIKSYDTDNANEFAEYFSESVPSASVNLNDTDLREGVFKNVFSPILA
jgi:hypothetical protein